jgi:hypothetical protein
MIFKEYNELLLAVKFFRGSYDLNIYSGEALKNRCIAILNFSSSDMADKVTIQWYLCLGYARQAVTYAIESATACRA